MHPSHIPGTYTEVSTLSHTQTHKWGARFDLSVTHAPHSQGLVTTVKSEPAFIPAMANAVSCRAASWLTHHEKLITPEMKELLLLPTWCLHPPFGGGEQVQEVPISCKFDNKGLNSLPLTSVVQGWTSINMQTPLPPPDRTLSYPLQLRPSSSQPW